MVGPQTGKGSPVEAEELEVTSEPRAASQAGCNTGGPQTNTGTPVEAGELNMTSEPLGAARTKLSQP